MASWLRRWRRTAAVVAGCWVVAGAVAVLAGVPGPMTLRSSAFPAGGEIPRRFTCDGAGLSPPLSWSGVPATARSLVLIVDDPDAPDPKAPRTIWTHWVLYDIPVTATRLPEAVAGADLPPGTREGLNDWKRLGYGGPCPPIGRHRYFFHLFALDETLHTLEPVDRPSLLRAISGHVVGRAELVGTYQRSR